jgi:CRISPR-associated protein Cas1
MADLPLTIPVRMLNEFTYCPRLFYLEWVQGEFADNFFTVDGRYRHRRADEGSGAVPAAGGDKPFVTRSVDVSSLNLGLATKLDVLEGQGNALTPVEYKRGEPPATPERSWEPERVQLCAQGLILRDNGYAVDKGVLYFAGSKERVDVPLTPELIERTRVLVQELRLVAAADGPPAPLVGSRKCDGCSLNAICLPDEVNHLRAAVEPDRPMRMLFPAADDALSLYVQEQGHRIGLKGDTLEVRDRDGKAVATVRLFELSQVVLFGNIQVTTQAIRELCDRAIPVVFKSYGGWYYGTLTGQAHKNVELRRAQFRFADDPARCLALAKRLVRTKLGNSRTILRRNSSEPVDMALDELAAIEKSVADARSLEQLLGIEGNGGRVYFAKFKSMLKSGEPDSLDTFSFENRNRRPPKDPVNALLSLAYSLLSKEWMVTLQSVGFDPHLGFYHQPKYGRPALALDMMEEFRPLVADSAVLQAINTGVVKAGDFEVTGLGVALKSDGRKRFLQAYERRLDQEITHPVFGYRISYRRVFEVQARLLGRFLLGEIPEFPEFRTR